MKVKYFVIPGGSPPFRGSANATGYDVHVRAVVSTEFDPTEIYKRKIIYDLRSEPNNEEIKKLVIFQDGQYKYLLQPGESVNIGLGLVFGMKPGCSAVIMRRSSTGLADIAFADLFSNEPETPKTIIEMLGGIPIDSDFRGEPISRLHNLGKVFYPIWHGKRIVQIVFLNKKGIFHPRFERVEKISDLGFTKRKNHCHGSTGL
ncbi:MAG: hypothetical protein WC666_02175 [Candidatus Paceibacterota bacterium]|jgi:dUTPase